MSGMPCLSYCMISLLAFQGNKKIKRPYLIDLIKATKEISWQFYSIFSLFFYGGTEVF